MNHILHESVYDLEIPQSSRSRIEIGRVGLARSTARQTVHDSSEMYRSKIEVINCRDLESHYRNTHDRDAEAKKCGLLTFNGGDKIRGLTGYNTTHPIQNIHDHSTGENYCVIAVRMEEPDDELYSRIEYFKAQTAFSTQWDHIDSSDISTIHGQDPAATIIDGRLYVDVVEVEQRLDADGKPSGIAYKTAIYRGSNIGDLEPFAYGPDMMKGIRHVQMPSGEVTTFTRPQHSDPSKGGRGQIGTIVTPTIEMIQNPNILRDAEMINTRFEPDEWGGINYATALQNGKIGVVGHIARFDIDDPAYTGADDKPKIYHPISAIYDPSTRQLTDVEILAMANEFDAVTPKRDVLKDVAYGTGITDLPDEEGNVMLFMGIGDAVTGYKMIRDPFVGMRPATDSNY